MYLDPELFEPRARLSSANRLFLERAEATPALRDKASFELLEAEDALSSYGLNAWPLFVDQATDEAFARAAVGVSQLIQTVPKRIFDGKANRLAEFYGLDRPQALFVANLLKQRGGPSQSVFARGDFVASPDGPKCLEMNMTSVLGGWQTAAWGELYPKVPVLADFLADSGIRLSYIDPMEVLFGKVCTEALDLAKRDGALNVAIVHSGEVGMTPPYRALLGSQWSRAKEKEGGGVEGEVLVCALGELESRREGLFHQGKRIHAIVEYYIEFPPQTVLLAWLQGKVRLYNGPIRQLLHDKRNLALLSERLESDLFDAEERRIIAENIPWSRIVQEGSCKFHGEAMSLPDLLRERREDLVIKPGQGFAGEGVHVGQSTAPAEWEEACAQAFRDGDWVVQEYVPSLPLAFHDGASGCRPFYVIFGLFAFGDRYGAGGLRIAPMGETTVVNAALGASEGLFFRAEDGS